MGLALYSLGRAILRRFVWRWSRTAHCRWWNRNRATSSIGGDKLVSCWHLWDFCRHVGNCLLDVGLVYFRQNQKLSDLTLRNHFFPYLIPIAYHCEWSLFGKNGLDIVVTETSGGPHSAIPLGLAAFFVLSVMDALIKGLAETEVHPLFGPAGLRVFRSESRWWAVIANIICQ
jgi:hypothetical protein